MIVVLLNPLTRRVYIPVDRHSDFNRCATAPEFHWPFPVIATSYDRKVPQDSDNYYSHMGCKAFIRYLKIWCFLMWIRIDLSGIYAWRNQVTPSNLPHFQRTKMGETKETDEI